ncbi:MAG: DUF1684 domain-containing protein [Arenimonas sp.]|nr:DUF1684 domain-containing protein [Arenimonas sp.]
MKRIMLATLLGLAILATGACSPDQPATTTTARKEMTPYEKQILEWRAKRVQTLTKPDGWLSLVGMHWLEVGNTRVGAAADNGTRLAVGPPHLGVLKLRRDGTITFDPEQGAEVAIDGKPAVAATRLIADGDPTAAQSVVSFNKGDASFVVINRGDRFALRVRDALAPSRSNFPGIRYFDIDPSFRFKARFTPHKPGSTIEIINVLGMIEPMENPGTVTFEKDGKAYTLEAVDEGDHRLFLMYADRTSGHDSYPSSRYLYAEYPDSAGHTIVDFNQGYSPPCAFTDFATCPLPPLSNRLDLAITAGEKKPLKGEAAVAN